MIQPSNSTYTNITTGSSQCPTCFSFIFRHHLSGHPVSFCYFKGHSTIPVANPFLLYGTIPVANPLPFLLSQFSRYHPSGQPVSLPFPVFFGTITILSRFFDTVNLSLKVSNFVSQYSSPEAIPPHLLREAARPTSFPRRA
jgi:hypothetical protein